MNEQTISLRGGAFEVLVAEAGDGRPTLYLHGELPPPAWLPWMDRLATDRRLIAPRHPGFAGASGLEQLDNLFDLLVYYLDFLDAEGLDSFDLIGESFGGMLAAELAALVPGRIRRLVLVAPLGLWLNESPVADVFGLGGSDLHQISWADPADPVAQAFAPDQGEDVDRLRWHLERLRALGAAGKFLWPIPERGLRKRLHRIAAPTLLLWGAEDQIVPPPYGRAFQAQIRGSELIEVPGAGHFPLLEQPEASLEAIRRFLG